MVRIFSIAMVSVACLASAGAYANIPPRHVVLGSDLLTFQVDSAGLGIAQVNDGRVDLDVTDRIVQLELKTPEGQKYGVRATLTSTSRDACGTIIYTAIRTVSSAAFASDIQTIVVRDHTNDVCPGTTSASRGSTDVQLIRSVTGRPTSISKFAAERLAREDYSVIQGGMTTGADE
jgi:hypothetical protein